jgi:Uma2 family endonuclease
MSVATKQDDPLVVLHDVPWETYLGIVNAIGENHLWHTYDQGTFEVRSLVYGVTWDQYKKFLEALGDYNLRHSYDGWNLEMMSPRKDHDWEKRFVGRIVEAVALALDIDIQCIGSTTLSSDEVEKGVQPDEAYYVANELVVRGKDTYEPDVDPPPDLILEVDVTSSSVPRMPLFAKLGIPEVWRRHGKRIRFHKLLKKGDYKEIDQSIAFPMIRPADIDECLKRSRKESENAVLRWFLDVLQQRSEGKKTKRTKGKKRP